MNVRFSILLVSMVALLSGCMSPPQLPVPLAPQALATQGARVGIYMSALPKVDTSFPGAGCLLCMAAASIANAQMTTYTQTLPYESLPQLKVELSKLLARKGTTVTIIDKLDIDSLSGFDSKAPNFARKNFMSLKAQHNIDKLVVIQFSQVGIERNYSAYIPVGDAKARVSGVGYLVNLTDNSLDWYLPLEVNKASDGKWDEPPKFPGLTNAYFQSLEVAYDQLLAPFTK